MDLPDIVYLVRPGDENRELRFSLRTLKNLPHGNVWIVGYQPSWTVNVRRIDVRQDGSSKHENQQTNLEAACDHPDMPDRFVLFNDDFFVMRHVKQVPVWHRGPFTQLLARFDARRGGYARRLHKTADHLGHQALSYDSIHTPLPVVTARMRDTLNMMPDGVLFRSVYGNQWQVGGRQHADVKISNHSVPGHGMFLSTSDKSFNGRLVGRHIRERFPDPSRYERA